MMNLIIINRTMILQPTISKIYSRNNIKDTNKSSNNWTKSKLKLNLLVNSNINREINNLVKRILSNFNIPSIASDNYKIFQIAEMDRLRIPIILADNKIILTEVTTITTIGIEIEDKDSINSIIIISHMDSTRNMLSRVQTYLFR